MAEGDTVTARFGQFISSITLETTPPEVVEKAKACLLNAFGIGLGSDHLPYARTARRAVLDMDGEQPGGATVFADGRKTSVAGATLANAVLMHGRNQEDFVAGSSHFGVVVPPLLAALIEAKRLPIERLVPATIAGYEIGVRLDAVYASRTTPNGFRGTPLFGTMAAAASVARLLELPAEQCQAAVANAAALAGGTLASQFAGTDEWRYQVGLFASMGMNAAYLAKAGSVSVPRAFEARVGFGKVFAGLEGEVAGIADGLGRDWAIMDVCFKPYPLPAWNQTPVLIGLKVREAMAGRTPKQIVVRMNPYEVNYPGKNSPGPFDTDTAAKLSILFTVATTLAHGEPTFPILLDYQNARTTAMLQRMKLIPDPEVPRLSCRLEVAMEDGQSIVETMTKSWRDYGFDCGQVSKMVRRVGAETGVPAQAYDRLDAFVARLPRGGDIGELVQSFSYIIPKA